jgi:sodium pump decarboxylase gamma subunit
LARTALATQAAATEQTMIKDATIVMILGMGTVFLVLVALLGLMTLGGKIALRYAKPAAGTKPAGATPLVAAKDTAHPEHQASVAVAVAAVHQREAQQKMGDAA